MSNVEKILLYIILVMQLLINILLFNKLMIVFNNTKILEEKINNLAVIDRIEYEDLLERIEISEGVKRGVY